MADQVILLQSNIDIITEFALDGTNLYISDPDLGTIQLRMTQELFRRLVSVDEEVHLMPSLDPGVPDSSKYLFRARHWDAEDSCPICQESFNYMNSNDLVQKVPLITPCNHMFCSMCIDTWLKRHATCPLCMMNIVTKTYKN